MNPAAMAGRMVDGMLAEHFTAACERLEPAAMPVDVQTATRALAQLSPSAKPLDIESLSPAVRDALAAGQMVGEGRALQDQQAFAQFVGTSQAADGASVVMGNSTAAVRRTLSGTDGPGHLREQDVIVKNVAEGGPAERFGAELLNRLGLASFVPATHLDASGTATMQIVAGVAGNGAGLRNSEDIARAMSQHFATQSSDSIAASDADTLGRITQQLLGLSDYVTANDDRHLNNVLFDGVLDQAAARRAGGTFHVIDNERIGMGDNPRVRGLVSPRIRVASQGATRLSHADLSSAASSTPLYAARLDPATVAFARQRLDGATLASMHQRILAPYADRLSRFNRRSPLSSFQGSQGFLQSMQARLQFALDHAGYTFQTG